MGTYPRRMRCHLRRLSNLSRLLLFLHLLVFPIPAKQGGMMQCVLHVICNVTGGGLNPTEQIQIHPKNIFGQRNCNNHFINGVNGRPRLSSAIDFSILFCIVCNENPLRIKTQNRNMQNRPTPAMKSLYVYGVFHRIQSGIIFMPKLHRPERISGRRLVQK